VLNGIVLNGSYIVKLKKQKTFFNYTRRGRVFVWMNKNSPLCADIAHSKISSVDYKYNCGWERDFDAFGADLVSE